MPSLPLLSLSLSLSLSQVCNTGDATATNVQGTFNWLSTTFAGKGTDISVLGPTTVAYGSVAQGACVHMEWSAVTSVLNQQREYQLTVSADNLATNALSTVRPVLSDNLNTQGRNSVTYVRGPDIVFLGEQYNFRVAATTSSTFLVLTSFMNFSTNVFRPVNVKSYYTSPGVLENG